MSSTTQEVTTAALSDPLKVLDSLAATTGVLEVDVQPTREKAPITVGPTQNLMATVAARGTQVVARFPHSRALESSTSALQDAPQRIVTAYADRLVGVGGLDLARPTPELLLLYSGPSVELQMYDPIRQERSEADVPALCKRSYDSCRIGVRDAFRGLGVPADDDMVRHCAAFVKEATDNAYLHARKSVNGREAIEGFHTAALRRITSTELAHSDFLGLAELREWANGIHQLLERRGLTEGDVLEVTVADSGEGIAATMRERLSIYDEPVALELAVLDRALQPGGTRESNRPTVAPSTKKGFGFPQMLEALRSLQGALVLWSGRTLLGWSSLEADGSTRPLPLGERKLQSWSVVETPLVRGTSVSMMVPLPARGAAQTSSLFDITT